MSGAEIAEKMLADNGIRDVRDFNSRKINGSLQSIR
jgi:Zn-dependent membrane protease YugP